MTRKLIQEYHKLALKVNMNKKQQDLVLEEEDMGRVSGSEVYSYLGGEGYGQWEEKRINKI